MAKAKATQGTAGQFTYDFGVQIAKGTVHEITKLAGVSLTLASAFYTLTNTAKEYLNVVTKNNLRMGGIVQAMREYETANSRLVKGLSSVSAKQHIEGMNQLLAVGIDVEKNFEWISKSAHAMGKSFDDFAGAIANGIHGNMNALVDMGLLTQRSTRMFEKYTADTVQRQQAILNFVKQHHGLQSAIKDDFIRIQDEMRRLKGAWDGFVRSIVGDPKSPSSLYGQIRTSVKEVADAVARNYESIKKFSQGIGLVLGWVVRQAGHVVMWLGKETKRIAKTLFQTTDDFGNAMRSLVVWLEFWKVHFVKIFDRVWGFLVKHEKLIFKILKIYVALKAVNWVWGIGSAAIASLAAYAAKLGGIFKLQKAYMLMQARSGMTMFGAWLQSLAVFLPRGLRKIWVAAGKGVATVLEMGLFKWLRWKFLQLGKFMTGFFMNMRALGIKIFSVIKSLFTASNPVGWIILAITLVVTLYKKCEGFRKLVNSIIYGVVETLKLLWNSLMMAYVKVRIAIKQVWNWLDKWIFTPVGNAFRWLKGIIKDVWDTIKDSAVGRFIQKYIVQPIAWVIDKIVGAWGKIKDFFRGIGRLWGANDEVSANVQQLAAENGINVKTFGTGTADYGTDWLNRNNWSGTPQPEERSISNDMDNNFGYGGASLPAGDFGGNTTTVQSGAIQIIVQHGDNIDEEVLKSKVQEVLNDLQRTGNVRSGRI